jgi:hypothetical protein
MGSRTHRFLRVLVLLSLIPAHGRASSQSSYPIIHELRDDDIVFSQLGDCVEQFHESEKTNAKTPELSLYSYILSGDTDVFSLAAACTLPYDTIATLNRIETAQMLSAGTTILIPSIPGIFVSSKPENDLELLVRSLWTEDQGPHYQVRAFIGGRALDYTFFPGATFHPSERTFFLVVGFHFPLPKGVITSSFGARVDPFFGKKITFHTGIDIGAPFGTHVMAARAGRIESTGYSDVYGNFIIIAHDATWETLYGHLSKIVVEKGQAVRSGDVIGFVGSTGMSTGPHLHFETRKRGTATNPAPLIMSQ